MDETENLKIDADEIYSDDSAQIACENAFKIKYMFPWQRLVVANILDAFENAQNSHSDSENALETKLREDDSDFLSRQIVLLPTGAGKSLCFQVPALLLPGATLIVYPLLALMSDQERRMNESGLKCVVFRGGQSDAERSENFRKLKEENYKIIIANPEVLENKSLLLKLKTCNISHIAIDEAHTVYEWGSTFRKSYLNLGNVIKFLASPVVTAFTATASPEVLENIGKILFDGKFHLVRGESDRANIHYYVYNTADKKAAALYLSRTEEKPMIIFCSTRNRAEDMSREINFAFGSENSRFYHAGLERSEKQEIEKWFFDRKDAVLCATCAFGMGVDKSDIRTVIHLDIPETAESYIQEAGRGGRDRNVANAILLWNYEDDKRTKNYKEESRKYIMRKFALSRTCRRDILLNALGAEEDAVCSGCDICDSKNGLFMPGKKLPSAQEILFNLIKTHDKYFTEETLEEAFLEKMNNLSKLDIGLNIWGDDSFIEAKNALFYERKIYVLRFLWKGRFSLRKENSKIYRLERKLMRLEKQLRLYSVKMKRLLAKRFRFLPGMLGFEQEQEQDAKRFSFSAFLAFSYSSRRKRRNQCIKKQRLRLLSRNDLEELHESKETFL